MPATNIGTTMGTPSVTISVTLRFSYHLYYGVRSARAGVRRVKKKVEQPIITKFTLATLVGWSYY